MMRSVFTRILYDKRWFMVGWTIAMIAMAVLMVAMYPSLKDGMESIARTMPRELQGLVGDISSFGRLDTYLSSQLYDIRIPLMLMIMSLMLAQSLSVISEERGEMRTTLATATSRTSLFYQSLLAATVIFSATIAVSALATWLSVPFINESLDLWLLTKLSLLSLLFVLVVFAITFGLGMLTGKRMIVMGAGIGLIIVSVILEAGRTVDWLDLAQKVSLLHYYDAGKLLSSGLDTKHLIVQLGLITVSIAASWWVFRRRDVS